MFCGASRAACVELGEGLFEMPVILKFHALAKSVVRFFQIFLGSEAIDAAGNPVPAGNRRRRTRPTPAKPAREPRRQNTERENESLRRISCDFNVVSTYTGQANRTSYLRAQRDECASPSQERQGTLDSLAKVSRIVET